MKGHWQQDEWTDNKSALGSFNDLDFAVAFLGKGRLSIFERGSLVGDFGVVEVGDNVTVEVNQDADVEYKVNSQVIYTSFHEPLYPLRQESFIMNPGGELRGLKWVNYAFAITPVHTPPTAGAAVYFHRFRGGVVAPDEFTRGVLYKMPTAADDWTGGAKSRLRIQEGQSVTGFSFKPGITAAHGMIGLNHGEQPTINYKGIDYGFLLHRDGTYEIFENGLRIVIPQGKYKNTHAFKMTIDFNKMVRYFHEGVHVYTSSNQVHYPVSVDVAFHDAGSRIQDIVWVSD